MLKKIGKRITNNFGLKILAAAISVLLWLIVVNVEDPNKTQIFTVTVTVENEDYLTSIGKTYEILDNTNEISFTVSGKRSIVEKLTESDFVATANMENIDETMTMIPITITSARYRDQIMITKKSSYMLVAIEDLITEEIDLEVVVNGTPAENCFVASTTSSPEKVSITGPKSVVSEIEQAVVEVNVEGEDEDIATNGEIVLLDKDGDAVDTERLELNRTEAAVDVEILMQREVSVSYKTTGTPAEGYRFTGADSDMDTITISGEVSLVELIDSLEIDDPQLNVEGVDEDFEVSIHIPDYLPDGINLCNADTEDATVVVHIVGKVSKDIQVPVENITIENLDEKWQQSLPEESYTVTLHGFEEDIASISPALLTGTIDASGVKEGDNELVVVIDGEYGSLAEAKVTITVKKVPEAAEDDAGDAAPAEEEAQPEATPEETEQ